MEITAWEFAADNHLLKLQRQLNKVLSTIGNIPRCTPVRHLHTFFNLPYIYDYVIKLCRQQAEVIQNHENAILRNIGKGGHQNTKYKRNLAAVKHMTARVTGLPL
jgi:hypothetical protein